MTKTPFDKMIDAFGDESRKAISIEITTGFAERMTFENREHPANEGIQVKLKAASSKFATLNMAAVIAATNLDTSFMNRSVIQGRRFNVYSINKLGDLLTGLSTGRLVNAVNIAVIKSMFKFRAADMAFNSVAALGATSDKVRIESGMKALLARHTVAPGTAQTQASSTMNAMLAIGAVKNTGTSSAPVWQLTDTSLVDQLEVVVA